MRKTDGKSERPRADRWDRKSERSEAAAQRSFGHKRGATGTNDKRNDTAAAGRVGGGGGGGGALVSVRVCVAAATVAIRNERVRACTFAPVCVRARVCARVRVCVCACVRGRPRERVCVHVR